MPMPDSELPDFTGKLLIFYVSDAPRGMEAGVFLEFAEFRRYGDRLFVVGRVPEKGDSGMGVSARECNRVGRRCPLPRVRLPGRL
jgi:hypothetical protein